MAAVVLHKGAWAGRPGPAVPPRDAVVLSSTQEPLASGGDKPGWRRRLHLGGHRDPADNQREKEGADGSPEVESGRGKRHRFSLSRLFRPEDPHHHEGSNQVAAAEEEQGLRRDKQGPPHRVAPLEIPPLLLMNERNGGVTVSGRRVPFTRAAHKQKRHKAVRPLVRILEDRALGQTTSAASVDAYRRRAYYAGGGKHKDKK